MQVVTLVGCSFEDQNWYIHELLSGRFASICFGHYSIFSRSTILTLSIFHTIGNLGKRNLNISGLIVFDLNILHIFGVDFQKKN